MCDLFVRRENNRASKINASNEARKEIVMAVNLVELVKGYLTPDILQKAGSFVGESESAILII